MNIILTPQLEELIQRKLESGRYSDANEVMLEALDLLDKRDRLLRLREAVASGLAQYERGEVTPMTPSFWVDLLREADEEDRLGLPIHDDVQP
jgi:antitoxin ParD1/3/4